MADDKDDKTDKTLEAIKRTKQQKVHNMKGPMGSAVSKDMANQTVAKDQERHSGNRAAKYANVEKEKIASKEHVREGTRGRLSKEFGKQANKEFER